MALIRKNEAFALLSIVVAATVLDVSVFSVSVFENLTTEKEKNSAFLLLGVSLKWH
jgi:hypothetical protein